ncbi:MAG: hypothetical protein V5A23_08980, partial [Halobacteriales archaeon]
MAVSVVELVPVVSPVERWVWGVALVFFGVGDAVTTAVAIHRYGAVETNPLVVRVAGRRPSTAATVAFKVGMLLAAGAVYVAVRAVGGRLPALLVPLLLSGFGFWAVRT